MGALKIAITLDNNMVKKLDMLVNPIFSQTEARLFRRRYLRN